jgi:hypothetical protein
MLGLSKDGNQNCASTLSWPIWAANFPDGCFLKYNWLEQTLQKKFNNIYHC